MPTTATRHHRRAPDRTAPDVRALRDAVGAERFSACVAQGSKLSYDELVDWLLAKLQELALDPSLDVQ